jgi:hypothetical protein
MNVSQWLLVVITVAVCAMAFVMVRLVVSLGPAMASLRRTSDRLGQLAVPAEATLLEVQRELEELRALTRRTNGILTSVEGTAEASRRVATEALGIVNLLGVTRRTRAAASGAQAALALLKHAVTRR